MTTPELTPRQMEVLGQLERGEPNRDIAAKLGISENTAREHVRLIIRQVGARNRTEAIYLIRTDLLRQSRQTITRLLERKPPVMSEVEDLLQRIDALIGKRAKRDGGG